MPRVSEIEEDGGDPTLKAIFDRQREMFGGLLGQSIDQSGLLPRGLPALLYVRVATINGCPF